MITLKDWWTLGCLRVIRAMQRQIVPFVFDKLSFSIRFVFKKPWFANFEDNFRTVAVTQNLFIKF